MKIDTRTIVHLFHIIVVGALFIYVGTKRDSLHETWFPILFYLGLFIIGYHLFKAYGYWVQNKSIWVNVIHILFIGPILAYIGYYGKDTSRKYFEFLLMAGFASIGYHLYYLVYDLII